METHELTILRNRTNAGPQHEELSDTDNADSANGNQDAVPGLLGNKLDAAKLRLDKYQKRWTEIGKELPPQINRSQCHFNRTGLFIGTATSLVHAGPAGTVIGYAITGTVVWSVVISIGEIVSFLPNVGGPVGLAGLYVDRALGFALGWNAWYNWTIILPAELSAAAILFNDFFADKSKEYIKNSNVIAISTFLFFVILINCFGSRAYGEAEFIFSCFKILTIIFLIIFGLLLDFGIGNGHFIGVKNWKDPGPFREFRATGPLGIFLGVWSSIGQAVFAFFGTEVPGVAAGEVQNPAKNIPRAINRVWIRITIFYVLAVFVAGLLVRSDNAALTGSKAGSSLQSPFVIALREAGFPRVGYLCNVAFVVSAFSAAVSDMYVSSRYLYYLGRCRHAPEIFTRIIRSNKTVVPWVGISVSALFGLLAYMSISADSSAEDIFYWLSSMTSTTALLSWIGMLFTYIRWYQGTKAAEKRDSSFVKKHKEDLYKHRYRAQPWIAIYALVMCIAILVTNGWVVFTRAGPWRMGKGHSASASHASLELSDQPIPTDAEIGDWVPTFVSSYLPLPVFLLLILGYKLIYRTKMVGLDDMTFHRGVVPEIEEKTPTTWFQKFLAPLKYTLRDDVDRLERQCLDLDSENAQGSSSLLIFGICVAALAATP
ncbi:hypothetical protein BDN70DRAFT_896735 [Pholiota conissans]|uniref:Amino acid permease/ SLC12A domain-containing protein n=1 Tax=Pholiota conissans TaxID=109636 RepID=A0A9P5YXW9_9AGAR|nr:hypothetical protein BDN70DRAFT_896735 [Pholiota conissans]